MKQHEQLRITDVRRADCPFGDRLESDDFHCNAAGINARGYDLIGEDSNDFVLRLAEVNGIDFEDIVITDPINPSLPRYIPTIPNGSGKLFTEYTPEYVAVSLSDVVSAKQMKVAADIHARLGVSKKTKVILLGFANDALLERMWPAAVRHRVIAELSKLDLHAVIPPDYSVWANQPHAERLINQKKSMIIYREMIDEGLPAIPHITWHGKNDIDEHIRLLERHPNIKTIALDLQTIGPDTEWQRLLVDLAYLATKLDGDMRCLITGPSVKSRIEQIIRILPNAIIVNSAAAQKAVRKLLFSEDLTCAPIYGVDKTDIMRTNDYVMGTLVSDLVEKYAELKQAVLAPRSLRFVERIGQLPSAQRKGYNI